MKRRFFLGFLGGALVPDLSFSEEKEVTPEQEVVEKVARIVEDVLHLEDSSIRVIKNYGEYYFILQTNIGEVLVEFTREGDVDTKKQIVLKNIKDYKDIDKVVIDESEDIRTRIINYFRSNNIQSVVDGNEEAFTSVSRLKKIQEAIRNILFDYFENPTYDLEQPIMKVELSKDDSVEEMIRKINMLPDAGKFIKFLITTSTDMSMAISEPDSREGNFSKDEIETVEFVLRDYWKGKAREKRISANERFEMFMDQVEFKDSMEKWIRDHTG